MERISKNMNLKLLFRLHPAQKLIDNIDLTSVLNHFKTHEKYFEGPLADSGWDGSRVGQSVHDFDELPHFDCRIGLRRRSRWIR